MTPLIKNKPFWALFGTQFLGAFNDNFFRTALITLITYHLTTYSEMAKSLFISAAFGLFMLPFFVFSPLAGQLADRFDKSKIIRFVKGAEIAIVSLGAYGFTHQNPYFLLSALFCMGIHSAFFGPVKYSTLPDILHHDNLLKGNGYIEAGTFLAIMLGTLWGALMIHGEVSPLLLSLQLLIVAIGGFLISWQIPFLPPKAPHLKIHWSWLSEMKRLTHFVKKDPRVFKSMIGIAWFWLVGTVLLSNLPSFAQSTLKLNESTFIFLLFLFTFGIGAGSILCSWLFKGEITTKQTPWLSLFLIPLLFDISSFTSSLGSPSLSSFLLSSQGLRLIADIFGLSFLGGLFIVPLYTFIQAHIMPSHLSQGIALSNIINAGFMVGASLISFTLLTLSVPIPTLIFLTALGQICVTFYIIGILPEEVSKAYLYILVRILFRLEVKGLENYAKAGKRVVLIANHISYLDAFLIAVVLPEKPLFAINRFMSQKWWVKPFLIVAKTVPIDPLYPYGLRDIIEETEKGQKVLIFPEGRLTITGSLMKVYEGSGMVAEKAKAHILPIRIDGAQYTFFSLLKGKLPRKFFPKITLTFLPAQPLTINPRLVGRARRRDISEHLYNLMATMVFTTSPLKQTLFTSLLESRKLYGSSRPILEDVSHEILTYNGLLKKSFAFSHLLARKTRPGEAAGLFLPNTHGLIISFWAFQAIGRVPALLNYSSGASPVLQMAQVANLKKVYTSRKFIEKAKLQETIGLLKQNKIQVHYVEDMAKNLRLSDKLWGLYGMVFPQRAYKEKLTNPEDPCVILFTSGSEGMPKGVPLTHLNIQANRYQLATVVDFNEMDKVFNTLPLFHAFGLTAGMVLPLLSGIQTFHYISLLHYRAIAELVYSTNSTILFGTDTFLAGYGRAAHAYDFHTLRYVFAGAEKLKETTQHLWFEKFGLRIFEGYGTTETSPVLCVNTAMQHKAGTVGKFLPGVSYHLESIEGIDTGGRLWVQGPNVMKGYLAGIRSRKSGPRKGPLEQSFPDFCFLTPGPWYDTGDIAEIDEEGYVTLKGRLSRFAKVGGEMVSLPAVEEAVGRLWPEDTHAVIAQQDPQKGERIVLYTTYPQATKQALIAFWKAEGLSDISRPKILHILSSMPMLGSGKVNYKALPSEIVS